MLMQLSFDFNTKKFVAYRYTKRLEYSLVECGIRFYYIEKGLTLVEDLTGKIYKICGLYKVLFDVCEKSINVDVELRCLEDDE